MEQPRGVPMVTPNALLTTTERKEALSRYAELRR